MHDFAGYVIAHGRTAALDIADRFEQFASGRALDQIARRARREGRENSRSVLGMVSMMNCAPGASALRRRTHSMPSAPRKLMSVMAKMRGAAEFADLWERRTTLQGDDGTFYELMALPDLFQAKKTQRDEDWPMIRRLIEADRVACQGTPSSAQSGLSFERWGCLLKLLYLRDAVRILDYDYFI